MDKNDERIPSADAEALRVENLKRKYQTAIGRLPYGIPAAELKDKGVDVACCRAGDRAEEGHSGRMRGHPHRGEMVLLRRQGRVLVPDGARREAEGGAEEGRGGGTDDGQGDDPGQA